METVGMIFTIILIFVNYGIIMYHFGKNKIKEIENHGIPKKPPKREPKIFFECDRRACDGVCRSNEGWNCNHTSNVLHARNFHVHEYGDFFENIEEG